MEEIFISKIHINKVRHLENVDILLSETERKHLILTGKNGSGKTSVLDAIKQIMLAFQTNEYSQISLFKTNQQHFQNEISKLKAEQFKFGLSEYDKERITIQLGNDERMLNHWDEMVLKYSQLDVKFTNDIKIPIRYNEGKFLLSFFNAKRTTELKDPNNIPTGFSRIQLKDNYTVEERANKDFIQHIVNLKADRSFARDDNDEKVIKEIDEWFNRFEVALKDLFGDSNLRLKFDRKNYNFSILTEDRETFYLTQLSDGYFSIIDIISEILMRMENKSQKVYDLQGIVLIDEIETHLHIDLQKKILPFLTSFFPKIQFIVTTHSPFVLSSISNAVIFDLEKQERTEDLSGYSLDAIVESYFDSDKYSEEVTKMINEYEILSERDFLSEEEEEKKFRLKMYFKNLPKTLAPELSLKISQIELATLVK